MKLRKAIPSILILLAFFQFSFGQNQDEVQPIDNWLREYNIYHEHFIYMRYDRYSKNDILKFREKLDLMKASKSTDEWEGVYGYDFPDEVGLSQLRLNSQTGYVTFYVYSCMPELRSIDYGKIVNSHDSIQLSSEFKNPSKDSDSGIYIKVKWNDRYYLVEEKSLSAFAEKAVGIYAEPVDGQNENYQKWARYWVTGDLQKPLTGLPEFPKKYKELQRLPIEARITSIGKRTVEEKTFDTKDFYESFSESAWYPVKIDAGKIKGVKPGMKFYIPDIEDELFIIEVNEKSAIGLIRREIDDNKNDLCLDGDYKPIECPKLKTPLKIKTPIGRFWW